MRNRAKCKLCNNVIESFHHTDFVPCGCGHIFVNGGDALACGAGDWANFLRVDDEGNEIQVRVENKPIYNELEGLPQEEKKKKSKQDLKDTLDIMIKGLEDLPPAAMTMPVTHYDYASLLIFLRGVLDAE